MMLELKGNMLRIVLLPDLELEAVKFVAWFERPSGWNLPAPAIPLGLGKTAQKGREGPNDTSWGWDVQVCVGFVDD